MDEVELDRDDDARRAIDGPVQFIKPTHHAFEQEVSCDLGSE